MRIQTKLIIVVTILSVLCTTPAVVLYSRSEIFSKTVVQVPQAIKDLAKAAELNSVSQYIRYYDEVLTQSARNYTLTGETSWKERYGQTAPLLDAKIKEAIDNGTDEERSIFEGIDAANQSLVVMELESMKLVDQGDRVAARAILDGDEYSQQKNVYQSGLEAYYASRGRGYSDTLTLSTQAIDNSVSVSQNNLKINLGIMVLIALLCVLAGFTIYFFVRIIIFKRLEKFAKATEEIAKGNLAYEIESDKDDEIGRLSKAFNEMARAVKSSREGIEKEVKDKTTELERVLKSTEGENNDLEDTKKAVLNVMEDLAEEKDRMTIEKNRLGTILESIGDGVFVVDKEGRVQMTNRAAQTMSGLTQLESVGKPYTEIFRFRTEADVEKEYPDFVMKAITTGETRSLENHTVIVHKDGSMVSVLDSAAPILDSKGKVVGCVVVFRNNTRERELEKNKDDFLSVTSHQLRTPLGSMRWNLEMLMAGDVGKLPNKAEVIVGEIYKGNIKMIQLVNDLLNVNRIDQGVVMDEPTKTDLSQIIKDATTELEFETKARKIKVSLSFEKVPSVFIDPKRFREVVMNLMSNAMKYNNAGGRVGVNLKADDKQVRVCVEDNGIGIPKNEQSSLFSKFFRASNAVHSETNGSGLGLYVVKKFVDGWGGKIELVSNLGKGTKITIILPLDKLKSNKDG